jgi:tRNA (guanine37-N1)-methyltransferase
VRIDIVTLFPRMVEGPIAESILGRARERGLIDIRVVNLREYAEGKHRVTDDYQFGGGGGMVLKPEPLFAAVDALRTPETRVALLCPQGPLFTQAVATRFAGLAHLVLLCGHYEGVDERVRTHLADEELSIGDYVLTGGELPALVVLDAVVRLLPGVLGDPEGPARESFATGRLDYPQYTRPAEYRGFSVPAVLLSGDHGRIARWRRREAFRRTLTRRPDLLTTRPPSAEERQWLRELTEGAIAPESTD